jgi:uncharacterized protein YijF (DUF1287 family)
MPSLRFPGNSTHRISSLQSGQYHAESDGAGVSRHLALPSENAVRHVRLSLVIALLLTAIPLRSQQPARDDVGRNIARAAATQVGVTTIYDPSYVRLGFPGGDLPLQRGVCADVVIRALRKVGVDLQVELHRDMRGNFSEYPRIWRLKRPDRNIDHHRVPNLMRYFTRMGKSLPARTAFQPGDIVAWRLPNNLYHIGIVDSEKVRGTSRHYMIHNIGAGAQREDILNSFTIIGHYRWSR